MGDKHPDAIVTRHNLAELFIALGDESSAREVQDHLLELLDVDPDSVEEVEAPAAAPSAVITVQGTDVGSSSGASDDEYDDPFLSRRDGEFGSSGSSSNGSGATAAAEKADEEFLGLTQAEPKPTSPPITFATRKHVKKSKKTG